MMVRGWGAELRKCIGMTRRGLLRFKTLGSSHTLPPKIGGMVLMQLDYNIETEE